MFFAASKLKAQLVFAVPRGKRLREVLVPENYKEFLLLMYTLYIT